MEGKRFRGLYPSPRNTQYHRVEREIERKKKEAFSLSSAGDVIRLGLKEWDVIRTAHEDALSERDAGRRVMDHVITQRHISRLDSSQDLTASKDYSKIIIKEALEASRDYSEIILKAILAASKDYLKIIIKDALVKSKD